MGVPIRDPNGRTPASLAVAMPSARCPRPRVAEPAAALRTHADAITKDL